MSSWFEQLSVLRSHRHRVDGELVAVARDEYDDLEQVARTVWTDDEPSIGILTEIVDDEWVRDGMGDVVVVHAVASSRSMDLHTP